MNTCSNLITFKYVTVYCIKIQELACIRYSRSLAGVEEKISKIQVNIKATSKNFTPTIMGQNLGFEYFLT